MLYSERSLLLLAGLPAVLSFGTSPFMGNSGGDDLAVEASTAVKLAVLNYPDTICQNLDVVDIIASPNQWCNTNSPTKEKCQNGNRLRLGPSDDPGAKSMTVFGEATTFDICAWDDVKQKCVMSGFSYYCNYDCPGVFKFPGAMRNQHTYIQTECLAKTRESTNQFYKDGASYFPKYLTELPATCEQKLVRCCSTQRWVTPWDDQICGEPTGGYKDGCCSNEDCPSSEGLVRRMEEDLEDDETKLKPRVGRRLSEVCPTGTVQNEMDDGGICCVGTALLFPDANWFAANRGQSGYKKGDPRSSPMQYQLLEYCQYNGGNTCNCEQTEEAAGRISQCPLAKPTLWGMGDGR